MNDQDRWAQFFTAIMEARAHNNGVGSILDGEIIPKSAEIADLMLEEYHLRFVKDTPSPYRG